MNSMYTELDTNRRLNLLKKKIDEQSEWGSFSITIITGNSTVLKNRIIEEILSESDYSYYIPSWNLGQIIVEYMEL